MKHYKRIETSREVRLWIGQVITPVIATVIATNPEAREKVVNFSKTVVDSIKSKFKK